jgi:RNA polymerase sigma factor (sigma-70 family)
MGDVPTVEALTVPELLERCAKSPPDEAAWEEFVHRYHSTIRASVAKTFQRKALEELDRRPQFPDDQIDDLIQAVYLRLVDEERRAIQSFAGEHDNSIYQYLSMIAVNVVRDHFREAKALKRPKVCFSLDELIENVGDRVLGPAVVSRLDGTPANSPNHTFTREELDEALERAVRDRHRERDTLIFKLRYYDGLTLDEIKDTLHLDLSPVSVGSILNRIALRLKPLLDKSSNHR